MSKHDESVVLIDKLSAENSELKNSVQSLTEMINHLKSE